MPIPIPFIHRNAHVHAHAHAYAPYEYVKVVRDARLKFIANDKREMVWLIGIDFV